MREELKMQIIKEAQRNSKIEGRAVPAGEGEPSAKIDQRRFNVAPTNPTGRPKGSQNKVTANIRAAVEKAAREVTTRDGEKGLTAWLLERARGGIADRQIFAGMVKAALPLKVDATVQTISINLGWLGSRPIDGLTLDHTPGAGGPGGEIAQAIGHASSERLNASEDDEEIVDKSMG